MIRFRQTNHLLDLRVHLSRGPLADTAEKQKTTDKCPMTNDLFAVGVGIEPTSRAFQARANPSQLSNPRHLRFKISDCRLFVRIPGVSEI